MRVRSLFAAATLAFLLPSSPLFSADYRTADGGECRLSCEPGAPGLDPARTDAGCSTSCQPTGEGMRSVSCPEGSAPPHCQVSCSKDEAAVVVCQTEDGGEPRRCAARCSTFRPQTAPSSALAPWSFGGSGSMAPGQRGYERLFLHLVADVYWSRRAAEPPAALAGGIYEALGKAGEDDSRAVVRPQLSGPALSLYVDLGSGEMGQLRRAAAPLVTALASRELPRRRFNARIEALARSFRLEPRTAGQGDDRFGVWVHNPGCPGAHDFELAVKGGSWLRPRRDAVARGVSPGRSVRVPMVVDVAATAPGEHRLEVEIRCLTCPASCKSREGSQGYYLTVKPPR